MGPNDLLDALLEDEKFWETLRGKLNANNERIWRSLWRSGVGLAFQIGETRTAKSLGVPLVTGRTLAQQYFEEHGLEFVKNMTETDIDRLRSLILEHWGSGEREFARTIEASSLTGPSRLRTIYRTEIHSANENAGYSTAQSFGAVAKQWRAVMDERTRPEHAAMDDEVVAIDEPFSNGSMHAGEEINCRCRTIYLTEWPRG